MLPHTNPVDDKFVEVPITEMSSYTLLQKMENNDDDFIIVDVRNKDAYDLGHIKGAISIPLSDIDTQYKILQNDKIKIIYCWSQECMLGPTASSKLTKLGVKNLREFRIGWCEWSERGYPIDGTRYILLDECLVPQRSINNETVIELDTLSYSCAEGEETC